MKKLLATVLTICCLFISAGPGWAAGETDDGYGIDNSPAEKIEIAFKVGDDTIKINGKDVKVVKPFVSNGATLVPVRVITEAFGAEIIWNGSERSITIKYSDVTIRLILDSKEATVNGKMVTMQEAPAIVNGTTMIPLRFITENFGADVGFDKETAQITVSKEIASSTSIKDFSMILKKTTKVKVGDSYYQWSMSLPKNLKISYRDFKGVTNYFTAVDETYSVKISVSRQEDETLDSLLSSMMEYVKDYTLINYDRENKGGHDYVKLVYKDSSYTYEDRKYIDNGNVYTIELYAKDYNTYKDSTEIPALLDSFSTEFVKDGKIEDLSDVGTDGYRTYNNKKFKWSIKVPADWDEDVNEDKENEVGFNGENNTMVKLKIYSLESGLTLEKWTDNDLKVLNDQFNPELVKVLKVEDGTISGVKCKKIYMSVNSGKETLYTCDFYFVGLNYRYDLSYFMDAEVYNDSTKRKMVEGMLDSFKFTEPKVEDIGKLLDPDSVGSSDTTRTLSNKEYRWSVDLPASWVANSGNNGKNLLWYQDSSQTIFVQIAVNKETRNLEEFIKSYEDTIKAGNTDFKLESSETISDKGASIRKNKYTASDGSSGGKNMLYVFNKDGYFYMVSFYISDLRFNEKNRNLIDSIWQSMKFE